MWRNTAAEVLFNWRTVTVVSANQKKSCCVLGIDDKCRLIVKYGDGKVAAVPPGKSAYAFEPGGKVLKVRNLILCALFVALIAAGAFIRVPIPVIPFTLQFLFTMMAGLLLGGKLGAVSVGICIAMGLLGRRCLLRGAALPMC